MSLFYHKFDLIINCYFFCRSFLNRDNVAVQPTFEDLIIDDNLSELERVVHYVNSTIGLQRLVHVKMISSVADSFSFEQIENSLVPLFSTVAKDSEPSIRRVFAAQLPQIAKRCIALEEEKGYRVVVDHILPTIATLLEDDKAEIRETASSSLVEISVMITPEDLGIYVLTIVLTLAHDDANEDMRITASVLFNLLADTLGQDLCKQFVIPEVVSLAEDPGFRVRKSTALNFQHICKVGGEHELFERLMPAFVRLSKDEMYRVRRACADSLASISEFVDEDIRVGVLVEIFLRLAQDPSKLVKQSILQQSGMFIASLPGRVVNSTILELYCSLAWGPLGDATADSDLKKYCAYSFPGVLQSIGADRWGEVREVYHTLAQSQIPAVMQTMGLSLHVVARLLGERIVEEELVPVFEEMIQDSDKVRMGIIKYLAEFLVLLSVPCRVSYLPLLNDLLQSANPLNWRLRQSLAFQLSHLMDLLPAQNLFGTLFPLTMALLQDPVFEVRRASYDGVVRMVIVLYVNLESPLLPPPQTAEDESFALADLVKDKAVEESGESACANTNNGAKYLASVARAINALTFSESYQQRQAWAELSLRLLREIPQHIFEMYFVQGLIQLASDPVPNVRVAAAETITGWDPYDYAPWETPNDVTNSESGPLIALSRSDSGDDGASRSSIVSDKPVKKRTDRPCPWIWLLAREDIKECVLRLSQEDNDVFQNMKKLQKMFPAIEFEKRSCRGLREAPGGPSPTYKRDRTLSMEERLLSQPAVNIEHRTRAASELSVEENKMGAEGALDEGVNEMAPWVETKAVREEEVDEETIEKMFDITPSNLSDEERKRFLVPDRDDDDLIPSKEGANSSVTEDVGSGNSSATTSVSENNGTLEDDPSLDFGRESGSAGSSTTPIVNTPSNPEGITTNESSGSPPSEEVTSDALAVEVEPSLKPIEATDDSY